MARLKAGWTVTAGVIPGTQEKEHTRTYFYTSDDYEADIAADRDGEAGNLFTDRMKEAHGYAMGLSDPRYLNWVRIEFMWL